MNYKNEMIMRYIYLKENVSFIYAYFMKETDPQDDLKYAKLRETGGSIEHFYNLDIKPLDSYTLYMLESLIVEDGNIEETMGYNYIEDLKWDPHSKEIIDKGLSLQKEYKEKRPTRKINFELIDLLFNLYENIARQTTDLENRNKKLKILDEYIKIARYTNDGHTWKSGYHIETADIIGYEVKSEHQNLYVDLTPNRAGYDVGIKNNTLIEQTSRISFSERDKMILYHYFHEEIPYNTFVKCGTSWQEEIDRPANYKPCCNSVRLDPKKIIAVEDSEKSYVFFMPCCFCESLIEIDESLIPLPLQEELIWERINEPLLFELAFAKADLQSLRKKFNDRYR